MNQREKLLELFRQNGGQATLSQIIASGLIKYTQRMSEMRKDGYRITCIEDRDYPGRNLYTCVEPSAPPTWKESAGGQLEWVA